jgi:hypothetical protein
LGREQETGDQHTFSTRGRDKLALNPGLRAFNLGLRAFDPGLRGLPPRVERFGLCYKPRAISSCCGVSAAVQQGNAAAVLGTMAKSAMTLRMYVATFSHPAFHTN